VGTVKVMYGGTQTVVRTAEGNSKIVWRWDYINDPVVPRQ